MTANKLSSAAKRLLAETAESERDRIVAVLVRVLPSDVDAIVQAIGAWGGEVRTVAGDVLSAVVPLRHLEALASLAGVAYVEAAEPLYPERRPAEEGGGG